MQFKKKINNNVALAQDSSGRECIVLGKGIGFSKKSQDPITDQEINRRFYPDTDEALDTLSRTLINIRPEVLQVSTEVSRYAEQKLSFRFSNHHYIILADHIDYAITRTQQGIDYNDVSRWEVKRLYPREYETAKEAITAIQEKLHVQLPKSEEVFITYHFVNAQDDENKINETIRMTRMIYQILDVIELSFNKSLDEESFSYVRMINHLRYMLIRKLHGEILENDEDDSLALAVQKKCPREHAVTEAIAKQLLREEQISLTTDEKMFFTLHLWRVMVELEQKGS